MHSKKEIENLQNTIKIILEEGNKANATAIEAGISISSGLQTTVRLGQVETMEFTRDKSLGITLYKGHKKGSVSLSDLSIEAIRSSIQAACRIAEYTEEDIYAGLAEKSLMAKEIPDLQLYHPYTITPEDAIELAKTCEAEGLAADSKITNSEGGHFAKYESTYAYGNSHGFLAGYQTTRYSMSCSLIAESQNGMQTDSEYTLSREYGNLWDAKTVGQQAAFKTIQKLDARKIPTCQTPVIFAPQMARGLLRSFIAAISGGNLYRKSSFLLDSLHQAIFPHWVNITEDSHLLRGLGSAPFDEEGVATRKRNIVKAGVVESYVLSSYSARKLGMQTTGNAGGIHNVMVEPSEAVDLNQLLIKMDTGLLVTDLMGQGVNIVTGDYSRGAAGFWVEKGIIQFPVQEITIAGNLRDMFKNLIAIGADVDTRGNILTGSMLLEEMTVAGI